MNSNTVISMPSQLFTMRSSFKAVANGSVYIGEVDTDPTITTNQIQVYIEQENGTLVPVSQPIKINSAGLLTASGQVQKFVLTNTEYSMAVLNAYGVQEHYFPRVYDQGISAALEVEERVLGVGVEIYRGKNGQYVENGDVIPSKNPPYTHLTIPINGRAKTVAMSPVASGVVSGLTETSATIGGAVVGLSNAAREVLSIKDLPISASEGNRIFVRSFYANSGRGGGEFVYKANLPWSEHDGGVIIASGALTAWDGTEGDLATMLQFSASGNGCWVRQITDIDEYTVSWFGTTGSRKESDYYVFDAARKSKSNIFGGGLVKIPVGEYEFVEEFVCSDFVKFVGEDRRKCVIFGKMGLGSGKAVVRACKSPVGSPDTPEYLSYSGFSNCTINGGGTWSLSLYVRHCTNESTFDNVTVQNAKDANSCIIGSFYVSMKNHVSRDARNLGVVIGRKLFGEGGLNEVNACALNNLRGNYAGLDDTYHPATNPYAGACITIWSANSCAFDYVGGENAYGAGVVIRKGINSVIPNIYCEANGKGTAATEEIGVRVINADFPNLVVGSMNLTRGQKVYLESSSLLVVDEIYSETFNDGIFIGSGKVLLNTGRSVNNLSASDKEYVENIETKRIASFGNVAFTNYASLDSSALIFGESMEDVQVIMVPRVTITTTDPIIIGMTNNISNGVVLSYGTSFTEGVPIVKKLSSVNKGTCRLKHFSNSLPSSATGLAFDIYLIQYVCDYRVVFNRMFS
ncbi:hypothetical protein NTH51_002210 [Vibrio fluvialis]|nr:hypothetical protein [Vibrio fluvialis]